jgi:hypothetical protein
MIVCFRPVPLRAAMLLPVLIASQMDRATNPPVVASAGRPCADRMLMWEDGFCRPRVAECLEDMDGEDPVRKAFIKMSIQLYNYGEGWVLDYDWVGAVQAAHARRHGRQSRSIESS